MVHQENWTDEADFDLSSNNLIDTLFQLLSQTRQVEAEIEENWMEISNASPENPISLNEKMAGSSTLQKLSPKKQRRMTETSNFTKDQLSSSIAMNQTDVAKLCPSLSDPSWGALQSIREKCETRRIRGLRNNGNTCFINVILQSLLSCHPFRKLVMETRMEGELIQNFSRLAWDMSGYDAAGSVSDTFNQGTPLIPHSFFGIFPSSAALTRGTSCQSQEDAEELLSCMLNMLHEEELSHLNSKGSSGRNSESCCIGWDASKIQGQRFVESSISKIFGGSLLSEVRKSCKAPSIVEESFFSLSLDIDSSRITSVDQAIRNYFGTEMLHDDFPPPGKPNNTIQIQTFLHKSPRVLILHLQRFARNPQNGSLFKVNKAITFPKVLHLPDSVRKSDQKDVDKGPKSYELSAVVTHLGSTLEGGHYVCDVLLSKSDRNLVWLNCNDETICEVHLKDVLLRNAYILFYAAI